jgi:hypothetical protein
MITERPEKRARNLALVGLGWSVVLTAFFILVMLWTRSEALRGLTFLSSCGNAPTLSLHNRRRKM